MDYPEWMEKLKEKLNRKYKIKEIFESGFGLEIDFHNNFHYSMEHDQLEELYYHSISDAVRSEDGFYHICESIEEMYIGQIVR